MLRLLTLACAVLPYFVSAQCQPGDYPFESSCFSFNRVHGSFQESNSHCLKSVGGSLVTIYNQIENNWIQKLAVDNLDADYDFFWIGASDLGHTNTWLWTDGSPLNFTNFANGEPLEDRHCAVMQLSSGKWFADICTDKHQFVCQYPQSGGPTGASNTCPPCPSCSRLSFI